MNKKIFIIEDNVNFLYGLQAKFSSEGFTIATANGNESLIELKRKVAESGAEYIILDIVLPKFDGFEVLHTLKADDHTAKLPVFIFSNLDDKDTREKCEKLGAEQFFKKHELMLDEFVQKIIKIINNREKIKL